MNQTSKNILDNDSKTHANSWNKYCMVVKTNKQKICNKRSIHFNKLACNFNGNESSEPRKEWPALPGTITLQKAV